MEVLKNMVKHENQERILAQTDNRRKMLAALLCGILGCVCFGAGDWLMIYGDTTYGGTLSWLTEGVSRIPAWRNTLAMALAFPGILFYGIALFAAAQLLRKEKKRKIYRCLTIFSLTPWLCLHLFYIMILYLFAWLSGNGYQSAALPASEALFRHLAWVVPVSELIMLPPYVYWFFLLAGGKSVFPRAMAVSNPLVYYGVLKLLTALMPEGAFRLAFTNGLMSESMALWFGSLILWNALKNREKRNGGA